MFNAAALYQTQYFIKLIDKNAMTPASFLRNFPTIKYIKSEVILDIAEKYGWVEVDDNDILSLTERGRQIHNQATAVLKLRVQLKDVISISSPAWAPSLGKGVKAIFKREPDIRQCFRDAGLLEYNNLEIAQWWDEISALWRQENDNYKINIGRIGESLSFEEEKRRTGIEPIWTAVENFYSPYDILSVISSDTNERLFIEVKTSREYWDKAKFFISKSEWEFLSQVPNAEIHLWSIDILPQINEAQIKGHNKIAIKDISEHMPVNIGKGVWQITEIPFNSFKNLM